MRIFYRGRDVVRAAFDRWALLLLRRRALTIHELRVGELYVGLGRYYIQSSMVGLLVAIPFRHADETYPHLRRAAL